jgi:hypothetical protein
MENTNEKIVLKTSESQRAAWTEASAGVTDRDLACPQFRRN